MVLMDVENGGVFDSTFRILSKSVFRHTATLEQSLKTLWKKFGEDSEVKSG